MRLANRKIPYSFLFFSTVWGSNRNTVCASLSSEFFFLLLFFLIRTKLFKLKVIPFSSMTLWPLLQALIMAGTPVAAFQIVRPQFISSNNGSYVSEYIQPPDLQARKQATLALTETPSTTGAIATETMTAGMSYLHAASNSSSAFYVDLTIDAKAYPVLLDTGSPYLWLYSETCQSSACVENEDNLLSIDSAGLTFINTTFDLSYTQKTVASGDIVMEDEMIIANFKTHDFKFGLASEVPDIFYGYPFVGVLGLPADNSSVTGLANIVSFLFDNGDINHSKFTICIGEFESDSENAGLIFLGDTMSNLKQGEMYTSNLIKSANSHWEIVIDNVFVNDYHVPFDSMVINSVSTNYSRIGLLDSGTTSLVLPKNDALVIHSFFTNAITDGENYAIFCNSTIDIMLEISGKNWTISSDEYLGPAYSEGSSLEGYCVSNIQGMESTNDNAWILGILFMQNKYVEFDYDNQWIGLAERNESIKFVNPPDESSTVSSSQTTITTSTTTSSSTGASSTSTVSTHNSASAVFMSSWISLASLVLSLLSL